MIDFKEVYKYTKDLNVLYAEDEDMLREENIDAFEDFFKIIDGAVDGRNGLEKYKKFYEENGFYYDIVITDLNMPNIDGHKFIDEIYKINKEQNIIIISAYNESNRLIRLIEQGIDSFILKPIKTEYLLRVFYKISKNIANDKLAKEHLRVIEVFNKHLQEYNDTLNEKVSEQLEVLREKDKILFYQSKLAAMGEMMDAIAHQWKQPLSVIKINSSAVEYNLEEGLEVKEEDINYLLKEINRQVDLLVETIDEFRNFFRPDFKKEVVCVKQEISRTLVLLKNNLKMNNIQIQILEEEELFIKIIPGEFKHVLINLVNNSKDAFVENKIKDRKIIFEISKDTKGIFIKVKDNANGIPEDIIKNIFTANFTTKEKGKGTGIGLYMSKLIIEKIGGEIWVENCDGGACFNIFIPNEK